MDALYHLGAIVTGRHSFNLLKFTRKIVTVIKSYTICNLSNIHV